MQDFNGLILKKDLNENIIEHLKCINKRDDIQTLYSAFFQQRIESYLKVCYTEIAESNIKKYFDLIRQEYYKSNREECNIYFFEPLDNLMFDPDYPKGMLYYDSPDFLRIKHSKVQFKSESRKAHMGFWDLLKEKLFVVA